MNWKIVVEINLKKVLLLAGMVVSTVVACKVGLGEPLFIIIPAGMYGLFSKEV